MKISDLMKLCNDAMREHHRKYMEWLKTQDIPKPPEPEPEIEITKSDEMDLMKEDVNNYRKERMIKTGDVVECLVKMQPLKKGDKGTVKQINHDQPFPITVEFPGVRKTFPMKSNELKVLKTT